ncbi:hypothetical protein [Photobacterium lutimaris]|uniref:Uncharacterized protein n=1 Tax=Photobacterium lutimaris TaxID=388278 RepID=A0A2T3J347_9GAMM|nr:hypothetical protein [Photobacterium lutimaris]PSU35714.1 hypothetical protein C9I99_01465 [Photobacterium lutimaris]TDR78776.1 hypothetical protein DFP78_101289 [Photobacterium lutimaris]
MNEERRGCYSVTAFDNSNQQVVLNYLYSEQLIQPESGSETCCCDTKDESYFRLNPTLVLWCSDRFGDQKPCAVMVFELSKPEEKLASLELIHLGSCKEPDSNIRLMLQHGCQHMSSLGFKKIELSLDTHPSLTEAAVRRSGFAQECRSLSAVFHSYLPMYFSSMADSQTVAQLLSVVNAGTFSAVANYQDGHIVLSIDSFLGAERHLVIQS